MTALAQSQCKADKAQRDIGDHMHGGTFLAKFAFCHKFGHNYKTDLAAKHKNGG